MPNEEPRSHPTFEQRLEGLAIALVSEAQEREKADASFHARMEALARRHEALTGRHEALTGRHEALTGRHEALTERHEVLTERQEALTERHNALTMTLELMAHESEEQRARGQRDADAINALARIAEVHEHRLTDLEGPSPQ